MARYHQDDTHAFCHIQPGNALLGIHKDTSGVGVVFEHHCCSASYFVAGAYERKLCRPGICRAAGLLGHSPAGATVRRSGRNFRTFAIGHSPCENRKRQMRLQAADLSFFVFALLIAYSILQKQGRVMPLFLNLFFMSMETENPQSILSFACSSRPGSCALLSMHFFPAWIPEPGRCR